MCDFNMALVARETRLSSDSTTLVYTALFMFPDGTAVPVKIAMYTVSEVETSEDMLLNEAAVYAHNMKWHALPVGE